MSKISLLGKARHPLRTTRIVTAGTKNVIFRLSGTSNPCSLAANCKLNKIIRRKNCYHSCAFHH